MMHAQREVAGERFAFWHWGSVSAASVAILGSWAFDGLDDVCNCFVPQGNLTAKTG